MTEATTPERWVLLVEDDARIARAIDLTLRDEGIPMRSASDGVRALELARESRPALVLLDWWLPLMGGDEVAMALRDLPGGSPPVIVISASAGIASAAAGVGAKAYLRKPFDIDHLVELVRRWMEPALEPAVAAPSTATAAPPYGGVAPAALERG